MDEAESEATWSVVNQAFSEDLRMIQAQQRMIDTYPGSGHGGIAADRGLTLFRNLMKRLIEAEGANSTAPNNRESLHVE